MKLLARGLLLLMFVGTGATLLALQQGYYGGGGYGRGYRDNGVEQKDEFAFARLRYPVRMASYGGFGGFGYFRNGGWSEDYPRADRQFVQGVLRLTRIDARPYQEVIDPDSDEIFNWPWLYAVNVPIGTSTMIRPSACAATCSAAASSSWTASMAPRPGQAS